MSLLARTGYKTDGLKFQTGRTVPGIYNVIGTANSNATVTVNNQPTKRREEYWHAEIPVDNQQKAVWLSLTNLAVLHHGTNSDIVSNEIAKATVPPSLEAYTYDGTGNLTIDVLWTYEWDAENRLIGQETQPEAYGHGVPRQRVEYDYTPEGKRINKRVYAWNAGSFVLEYQLRYIWNGWNMIAELNLTNHAIIRYYGWGPDVSGSISGAGGVGGLLWCTEGLETYYYGYDGNGNVTVIVNAFEGTVAGMYEYEPFGGVLRATGPMAKVNPFRFSTKYQDEDTDLLYYGFRYYNPSTGRWLSRDPIGERGGLNLYGFVFNSPISSYDLLGREINTPPVVITGPLGSGTAGPDITSALSGTMRNLMKDWAKSKYKCKACNNLYSLIEGAGAWDIHDLKDIGKGELTLQKSGTGFWERTVQFSYKGGPKKVYWAGAVNYTLWGRMNYLCYQEFGAYKYSLANALFFARQWKFWKYGGDQTADAEAFTKFGYNMTSPESVALPPAKDRTADPNNVTPKPYLVYWWAGLEGEMR